MISAEGHEQRCEAVATGLPEAWQLKKDYTQAGLAAFEESLNRKLCGYEFERKTALELKQAAAETGQVGLEFGSFVVDYNNII